MRVLVIGGSGMIGRATVDKLLASDISVALVSRRRPTALPHGVHWFECDVLDELSLTRITVGFAPDAVLHLAALLQFACERDPAMATRVNVTGTLNVLEACRAAGVRRMVFGSSIAVYGQTSDLMREEGWSYRNTGIYGVSKLMGEALGERYQAHYGCQFVALRYSGVFGSDDDTATPSPGMSLVRKKILQCAEGRDVEVDGASGDERVHLTHIGDAAEATCLALLHPAPSHTVYNVAGPQPNYISLRELHDLVRTIVPSAGAALWKGGGKTAGPVDIGRICEDLGFVPSTTVAEGLRVTLSTSLGCRTRGQRGTHLVGSIAS